MVGEIAENTKLIPRPVEDIPFGIPRREQVTTECLLRKCAKLAEASRNFAANFPSKRFRHPSRNFCNQNYKIITPALPAGLAKMLLFPAISSGIKVTYQRVAGIIALLPLTVNSNADLRYLAGNITVAAPLPVTGYYDETISYFDSVSFSAPYLYWQWPVDTRTEPHGNGHDRRKGEAACDKSDDLWCVLGFDDSTR